ncbi:hypothetical protein CFS9_34760 [Flavobacterium sp. CFS9]|uniref:Uncharacterized protein n=1 Tax=Flavobacterium sp. CFS9 TaxID=3143118 RepID=A0AAT9H564_9FLAO
MSDINKYTHLTHSPDASGYVCVSKEYKKETYFSRIVVSVCFKKVKRLFEACEIYVSMC